MPGLAYLGANGQLVPAASMLPAGGLTGMTSMQPSTYPPGVLQTAGAGGWYTAQSYLV